MKEIEFRNWMMGQKRNYQGKSDYYTEKAINKRVSSLKKLEKHFKIDLDSKVINLETAKEFLIDIRNAYIEDLAHTPLSNAFRRYFEFATGLSINKIF